MTYNCAYIRPGRHLLQRPVCLTEPLLDPHPIPVRVVDIIKAVFIVWVVDDRFVDDIVGLVCEDVEGDLGPLLLDVLDEQSNLHRPPDLHRTVEYTCTQDNPDHDPDLLPDQAHSRLVPHEAVHGHAVLNDQGRDGNEG